MRNLLYLMTILVVAGCGQTPSGETKSARVAVKAAKEIDLKAFKKIASDFRDALNSLVSNGKLHKVDASVVERMGDDMAISTQSYRLLPPAEKSKLYLRAYDDLAKEGKIDPELVEIMRSIFSEKTIQHKVPEFMIDQKILRQ